MKAHDCWDDPLVPSITAEHLEVMTAETLSSRIVHAEIALNLAKRGRDLNLIAKCEEELDALVDEQRSRMPVRPNFASPYFRLGVALAYALALEAQRPGRR